MKKPTISDLSFSENAYFYHVCGGGTLSVETVKSFCNQAIGGNNAYWVSKIRTTSINPSIKYTARIFKSESYPTFLSISDDYWKENKVGFILIIEYKEYVAILKRNTASIKIKNLLEEIPYQTLSNVFLSQDIKISKMNMRNLDGSEHALQSRILEARNLRQNVSAFGLNRYYLQSYKGEKSNNEKFSLAMGTSRVNWNKTGVDIDELCEWVARVVDAIVSYSSPADDFLSVFAKPISYKSLRSTLVPSSALIYHNELLRIFDDPNVRVESYDLNGNVVSRNLDTAKRYVTHCFSRTLERLVTINKRGVEHYHIVSEKGVEIVLGSSSITMQGPILNRVRIFNHPTPEYNGFLCDVINANSWFNIYFSDTELYYSHKALFQDHRLIESAANLLNNMVPDAALNSITCEKRHINNFRGIIDWDADSLFKYVENKFISTFDHFVCDDCDDEWADHIGVSANKVSFFCSKHNTSVCSASDFQDIVSQALKNLGNITPSPTQLSNKITHWRNNHTTSSIPRYRGSGTISDMETKWKNLIYNPNVEKEMCLIVNFISKSEFARFISAIKTSPRTVYSKSSYQLLWLLSSFVASCVEVGVKPIIYCKP